MKHIPINHFRRIDKYLISFPFKFGTKKSKKSKQNKNSQTIKIRIKNQVLPGLCWR